MSDPISVDAEMLEYQAQADRLWNKIPAFNVLQVRYFQNIQDIYTQELQDVTLMFAKDAANADLKNRVIQASAFVEQMQFIINKIKTNVK